MPFAQTHLTHELTNSSLQQLIKFLSEWNSSSLIHNMQLLTEVRLSTLGRSCVGRVRHEGLEGPCCLGPEGKRLSDGAGTLGQQAHSALGKCQGLSTILLLSQCARLPPAFLSFCSSPSFPAGLWDCSQHPQLLASAWTRACPGYACTDQPLLADVPGGPAFDQKPPLHPHPYTCMLILTPTSSFSPLHTRLYAHILILTTAS